MQSTDEHHCGSRFSFESGIVVWFYFLNHAFLLFHDLPSDDMVSKINLWHTPPFLIYIPCSVATLHDSLGADICAGCGRDETAEQQFNQVSVSLVGCSFHNKPIDIFLSHSLI